MNALLPFAPFDIRLDVEREEHLLAADDDAAAAPHCCGNWATSTILLVSSPSSFQFPFPPLFRFRPSLRHHLPLTPQPPFLFIHRCPNSSVAQKNYEWAAGNRLGSVPNCNFAAANRFNGAGASARDLKQTDWPCFGISSTRNAAFGELRENKSRNTIQTSPSYCCCMVCCCWCSQVSTS